MTATATTPRVETVQEHLSTFTEKIETLNAILETVHDAMKHLNQYETTRYGKVLQGAVRELWELQLHVEYLQGNLEGKATAPSFNVDEFENKR
jgi:hypothetical protein